MMNRKEQMGVTGLWVSRVLLAASSLVLWSYACFSPPAPVFQGILLVVTFLGGAFLFLWRVVRYRTVLARRAAADATLGLAVMASTLAFLVTVLSNREEALAITRAATDTTAPLNRLRIVDFNVLHGIPAFEGQESRYQDTLAAFRVLDADIIVLQEVWNTSAHGNLARRLAEALHLNYVYARANGSRPLLGFEEGSAILSRLPILDARRLLLAPRTPWWECRIALLATIDVGGRKLTVCGLHCHDQNETVATEQANSLLHRLDRNETVIVAGDFNAGSDSAAVTQFTGAGFAEALPGGIDHLLLPRTAWSWKLAEVFWTFRPQDLREILGRGAEISDHPAIVADLVPE